jgi:hypothetical protein
MGIFLPFFREEIIDLWWFVGERGGEKLNIFLMNFKTNFLVNITLIMIALVKFSNKRLIE